MEKKSIVEQLSDIIRKDPEMLEELTNVNDQEKFLDRLEKIGKSHGLAFTRQELKESISQKSELSEENLKKMSGGWDFCITSNATTSGAG
jgi:hypothetical protein